MTKHNTFKSAYLHYLHRLYEFPQFQTAPRGQNIRELMPVTIEITKPTSEPLVVGLEKRDKELASYLAKENKLFSSMTDSALAMSEASKFWLKIQNPDGTINSNYGKLIWKDESCKNEKFSNLAITPWVWAKKAMISDLHTRQAVFPILRPDHLWDGNKDVTCTVYGHFFIRPLASEKDSKALYLHVHMRSQDIWLGMPYDLPWFMGLMDTMLEDLKPTYPDLVKGRYHHTADSLHLYERDFDKALEVLDANELLD